jgi:hypothetical protein
MRTKGRRAAIVFVAMLSCGVAARSASAAEREEGAFGSRGQFIVGIERAMGYSSWRYTVSANGRESKVESSNFNLLFANNGTAAGPSPAGARFAFDFVPIDSLTVGGTIGYYTTSGSTTIPNAAGTTSTQTDLADFSGYLIAPRVGYAFHVSDLITLWPRAAFQYWSWTEQTKGVAAIETHLYGTDVVLDGLLVVTPVPHLGFTVGPFLEVPLGGGASISAANITQTTTPDVSLFVVGVGVGMLGYL